MAQNLQLLKRRIKTSKNISQIAKAMEMISASKIKKAQNVAENSKPYTQSVIEITEQIIKNADFKNYNHKFINGNNSQKKLFIIISPDRGLIGSLNTELFRKVLGLDLKDSLVITVGNKAERYAAKFGYNMVASFPMGTSLPEYNAVYKLIKLIEEYYMLDQVGEIYTVFTDFISFFTQTPIIRNILPLKLTSSEIDNNEVITSNKLPYLFEPNLSEILDTLLPHYLEIRIFNALIQAYTSEQAARMVAMQNAKNNAIDIANFLTLIHNKVRQEKITNEILDITNTQ